MTQLFAPVAVQVHVIWRLIWNQYSQIYVLELPVLSDPYMQLVFVILATGQGVYQDVTLATGQGVYQDLILATGQGVYQDVTLATGQGVYQDVTLATGQGVYQDVTLATGINLLTWSCLQLMLHIPNNKAYTCVCVRVCGGVGTDGVLWGRIYPHRPLLRNVHS